MGYYIEMLGSTIKISKENSINIMEKLKEYIVSENPNWAFVNTKLLLSYCKDNKFSEVMDEIRYSVVETDGIYSIDSFTGEKLGSDFEIWEQLAPYVNNGTIQILGEGGYEWKWIFEDGALREE
jgi:hypothetical protein